MRIWIDTEFNGFNGEILSIALVAEDGDYLYEVFPRILEPVVPWVEQNVMPQIRQLPSGDELSILTPKITIKHKISNFLMKYKDIEIIADWPEDVKHLCDLLIVGPGLAVETPRKIKFTICRDLDTISSVPHHAYYDALANMESTISKEYESKS